MGKATSSSHGLGRSLSALGKIAAVGVGAAFAGLAVTLKVGFDELADGQKVAAQTAAAIKSTGGAANVTAKQVEGLANSVSRMTGIDDEAVQAGENILLTFTKVRNEMGKGNDIFNQANVAVADLATRLSGGAVPSAEKLMKTSIMLGKALQDPIKGVTALHRVGVDFDEGQKKQIASMIKAGDVMGAQKAILAELTKEVGGSAKAAGQTFPAQLAKLRNSFDEVASQVAMVFLPALNKGAAAAAKFLQDFSQAKGFKAKLNVVWTHLREAGKQIEHALRSAVGSINWTDVWSGTKGAAAALVSKVRREIVEALGTGPSPMEKLFVVGKPKGLLDPGNLDVLNRKIVQLGKGVVGTVESISIATAKGETLIPRIFKGSEHTEREAIARFKKTGENLGTFVSVAAANAYAVSLHNQQAKIAGASSDVFGADPEIDWQLVADRLVSHLATAIEKSGSLAKQLADVITKSFQQIDWASIGAVAAPGLITLLGTAFVTALDPSFWVHHWELALSIGIAAFSGVIGKFAGKLGLLVLGPLKGVGGEMVLAIASGIERLSPRMAEAFLVAINFAGKVALAAFVAIGKHFESAVSGIFRKLGAVAREILQAGFALAAIEAVKALISGFVSKIGQLWAWLKGLGAEIKSILAAMVGVVFVSAGKIGNAIVDGIVGGMFSLFTSVKDKIIGGVQSAIDAAMGVFGHSPQKVIGVALAMEILAGYEQSAGKLKGSVKDKTLEAIEAARQVIIDKQGVFASAFDGLVSAAMSAFDKLSSEFETKTEKKIAAQDERRAKADRQRALAAANAALSAAKTGVGFEVPEGETPEDAAKRVKAQAAAVKQAEQDKADAVFAIKRASDEKIATQERKDYEAKRERQRLSLDNRLSDLQNSFLQGEITVTQFTARMAKILDKAGIPLKNAAAALGASLAAGLQDAKKDAVNAAKELAQAIINQLGNISVIVKVHVASSRSGADDDKRAAGGPVKRGKQYLVGEQGPELFVPSASGKIVSNANLATSGGRAMGGGGSMVFNFPNYVGDRRELEDAMQSIMLTYQRRNGFGFAG